jgi:hypothetical protein
MSPVLDIQLQQLKPALVFFSVPGQWDIPIALKKGH